MEDLLDVKKRAADMKIGLMKMGKSVCFNRDQWKSIGADVEFNAITQVLAPTCREVHYWGTYNFGKGYKKDRTLAPSFGVPSNVEFLLDQRDFAEAARHDRLMEQVHAADVDAIVVVSGPHTTNNRLIMMCERYVWPVMKILNETTVPWIFLYTDWRYHLYANELTRAPQRILTHHSVLSQKNTLQGKKIEMRYEPFPVWALARIGQKTGEWPLQRPDTDGRPKGRPWDLRIVGNEKPGFWDEWTQKYLPALEQSGLRWEVWGAWPSAPAGDLRYRSENVSLAVPEVAAELAETGDFFVLATPHGGAGYLTQRWWELAGLDGLVWINEHYDVYNEINDSDAFVRVRNGQELVERIQKTRADWSLRDALLSNQRGRFSPEHEGVEFLGKILAEHLEAVVADPSQEAFPSSELRPSQTKNFFEIDLPIEQVKDSVVSFGEFGPRAVKSTSNNRALALMRGAAEAGYGEIAFSELCEMMRRDPHYADDRDSTRIEKAAVHVFSLMIERHGLKSFPTSELPKDRRFSVEEAMEKAPKPGGKRAKKLAAKTLAENADKETDVPTPEEKPIKERESTPQTSVSDKLYAAIVETSNEITKRSAREEKAYVPATSALPTAHGPLSERVMVALTDVNPFREGTATRVHFQIVIDAGLDGVSHAELAAKIVETKTQGVQTGERLAAWSFGEFPRKGVARVFVQTLSGLALFDPTARERKSRTVRGVAAENDVVQRLAREKKARRGGVAAAVFSVEEAKTALAAGAPIVVSVWANALEEPIPFARPEDERFGERDRTWAEFLDAFPENASPKKNDPPAVWVDVVSPRVNLKKVVGDLAARLGGKAWSVVVMGLDGHVGLANSRDFVEKTGARVGRRCLVKDAYVDDCAASESPLVVVDEAIERDGSVTHVVIHVDGRCYCDDHDALVEDVAVRPGFQLVVASREAWKKSLERKRKRSAEKSGEISRTASCLPKRELAISDMDPFSFLRRKLGSTRNADGPAVAVSTQ